MQNIRHPGSIIREQILKPREMSITKLAKNSGINRTQLTDIVNGEARVTVNVAVKLGLYTNTEAKKWLDHQQDYDLYIKSKLIRRTK